MKMTRILKTIVNILTFQESDALYIKDIFEKYYAQNSIQQYFQKQGSFKTQVDFFIHYIHLFVESWRSLQASDLIVTNTIGITNKTYIIQQNKFPQVQPEKIIFRHYGDACDGTFLDRKREMQIIDLLAQKSVAPQYYGSSDKVRIEEYLENSVLKQSQMKVPYNYRRVAYSLAKFHSLEVQVPLLDRIPLVLKFFNSQGSIMQAIQTKLQNLDIFTEHEVQQIIQLREWFDSSEIDFLIENLPKRDGAVCFSHNDLLANNILLCQPLDRAQFIDFEYSAYNYQAFDIGNYFKESQFDYDYPVQPYFQKEQDDIDISIIEDFVHHYALTYLDMIKSLEQLEQLTDVPRFVEGFSEVEQEAYKQLCSDLMQEIPVAIMLSNIFWGGWAIIMSHKSEIQFDYLTLAQEKFNGYKKIKEKFFLTN